MKDIRKYWPVMVILTVAVITTGIAGWQTATNPTLNTKDTWGFNLWFTPLGYMLLTWLFGTTEKINRPIIALGAVLIYALSIFLLFIPVMPAGLQWHYPIGAACLILIFFG